MISPNRGHGDGGRRATKWLFRAMILRRGTGWMGVVELVGLKRDITARTAGGAACEMPSVTLTGNAAILAAVGSRVPRDRKVGRTVRWGGP